MSTSQKIQAKPEELPQYAIFSARNNHLSKGGRFDEDTTINPRFSTIYNMKEQYPHFFSSKANNMRDFRRATGIISKAAYAGHDSDAADGGETVPTPLSKRIINIVDNATFMRQISRGIYMPSKTYEIPKKTTLETSFRIREGRDWSTDVPTDAGGSAITKGVWTSITLTADKMGTISGYTTELDEDSLISWGMMTLMGMARSHGEGQEAALIQGQLAGAGTNSSLAYNAGNVRYMFDGLIWHIEGDATSTGGNWTPDANTESDVMWIDGGSDVLTADELNDCMSKIEENRHELRYWIMRPKVRARMRDATEFEQLQSMKDIGDQAALIKGHVGRYYTGDIIISSFIPSGAWTGANTGTNASGTYGTNSDDTMVLGLDNRELVVGDRRRLEIRRRHRFYSDINEIRMSSRFTFDVERAGGIAGINDVKLAI
jgi:hypothetical protein